jgi:hypothetical protein
LEETKLRITRQNEEGTVEIHFTIVGPIDDMRALAYNLGIFKRDDIVKYTIEVITDKQYSKGYEMTLSSYSGE